jgi:predicted phosphohydrolase
MLSLAVTADLHMNHSRGQRANDALLAFLRDNTPDVLILAGDVAASVSFGASLERFADLPCHKAVTPGNHDLWVPTDHPDDSLHAYEVSMPEEAARHGFHWLDGGPMLLPEYGLAIAGSVNWYDYSWAIDKLRQLYPEEEHRLASKRFTRGRHNDAVFVRWPLNDVSFTERVTSNLERHLNEALDAVPACIVVTHHPPVPGMSFPGPRPGYTLDSLLWDAFAGNTATERLLTRHAGRIPFAFCGHTHRENETRIGPMRGMNIGGGYDTKRLLWLDWPEGAVTAHTFTGEE